MTSTNYVVPLTEEKDYFALKAELKKCLPGTCWDGSRIRGTEGWKEQLGPDTEQIFRDYVHTTWLGDKATSVKLEVFGEHIQTDYSTDIADVVIREIESW